MSHWIQLRKDLYRQVRAQVQSLVGETPRLLGNYQANYEKEFRRRWKASSREELIERLRASRLILLADFHALRQSQRAQLRILRALKLKSGSVLAVEFFESKSQRKIDQFMNGKLSEKDFLKSIQWHRRWGFPWENYRPIIRWAQKHSVRVVGLNEWSEDRSSRTLQKRDAAAAKKIVEQLRRFEKNQMVVIFGDWHLAKPHLPKQLEKHLSSSLDMVRVFQNAEKIYFQLLEKEMDLTTDVVRLDRDSFCLISVPPWVKWQNYLMDLEQQTDRELSEPEGLDYSDYVDKYLHVLSEDLSADSLVGSHSVYTARDDMVWNKIHEHFSLSKAKWIEKLIEESRSFYLPEIQLAYLGRLSVNSAASLAMAILYSTLSQLKEYPWTMPEDFQKLVWLETMLYLGSKLINPKRKTETLADIKVALASRNPQDQGREALQLALAQKMYELIWMNQGRKARVFPRPKRKKSYREAAQLLGGILGEKLFNGYRRKLVGLNTLQKYLRYPMGSSEFSYFYLETVEFIENLPDPFLSKNEKM